jgi:hypothetical protein
MGSRSQRKKERFEQRRNEKLKHRLQSRKNQESRSRREAARARQQEFDPRAEIAVGSNARHRERLARQIPRAWPGETLSDAAVFDDAAFSSLPPELVPEATAVRQALREALASRGDDALKRVSAISRGSPMSDWRLFIRGLIDWLADDTQAAGEAWERLDPERRPGRIATAMMVALRTNLEQATPHQAVPEQPRPNEEPGEKRQASAWDRFDSAQLYHAKLLRRVRFDRAALRIAEAALAIPEESKDLVLGPTKIQWLRRFIAEYGDTEPGLAAALAQAALQRAFSQKYSDLFDDAVRAFHGPPHDRRNRLLTFFYYGRFATDPAAEQIAERALGDYLNRDLPQNEALSAPLRNAIVSHIHLQEAMVLMRPLSLGGMFAMLFAPPEDAKAIRKHLLAAVKASPAHGAAYKAHAEWINSKLENDRLAKPARKQLENELADVMQSWSQGAPDDAEPRLWLVDYLLEEERLDEARPHVDFLAASRHEDPRVRATPWKWQLLEAMQLGRRKAWLMDVPARLDEAEALWPAWLPKQWLPYLRAAWSLRAGRSEAFEEDRRRICEETGRIRDSLSDACLMLAAAQQMRATAAELKPLRAAVDGAIKQIDALPLADLFETGSFFWDLHRIQLVYPAYRLHGKTIGKALLARLEKNDKLVLEGIHDERIQKAVLWASEYRFWPNAYETKFPSFFSHSSIQRHPMYVAARLNAFLKERYVWNANKYRDLGPLLREAAAFERDAFYRHWYIELADQADDRQEEASRQFAGFPFGNPLEADNGDDEDDDLGFDPDCNCPDCQAAKRAHQKRSSAEKSANR